MAQVCGAQPAACRASAIRPARAAADPAAIVAPGVTGLATGVSAGPVNQTSTVVPLRASVARSVPYEPGITASDAQGRSLSATSQPTSDRSEHAGPVAVTLTTWPGVDVAEYQAQPSEAALAVAAEPVEVVGEVVEGAADEQPASPAAITRAAIKGVRGILGA